MSGLLTKSIMLDSFSALANKLAERRSQPVTLIMGGGGAMVLAYAFPNSTSDVDAIPKGIEINALDLLIKEIAKESNLPVDWLNPYFSTYAFTLPKDYATRLVSIFKSSLLEVQALGKEDLLIMKCFAHRPKDVGHARALVRAGADIEFVENQILSLQEKKIPKAQQALDFLDEILEAEGKA